LRSACTTSDSSASRAFSVASSCSRRFSPRDGARTSTVRAAPVGEELLECAVSPDVGGTTICGGTLGAEP
jgi:hypothetical protein